MWLVVAGDDKTSRSWFRLKTSMGVFKYTSQKRQRTTPPSSQLTFLGYPCVYLIVAFAFQNVSCRLGAPSEGQLDIKTDVKKGRRYPAVIEQTWHVILLRRCPIQRSQGRTDHVFVEVHMCEDRICGRRVDVAYGQQSSMPYELYIRYLTLPCGGETHHPF